MSDYNSSIPVRTESNGDVVAQLADGTITSQKLAIDASGKITAKLDDGAGNAITSQANGGQQALDVGVNVAGVQVDPRDIRALTSADVVTAVQGAAAATNASPWWVHVTDGTNDAGVLATGELKVAVTQPLPAGSNAIGTVNASNLPTTVDTNFGAVGASTIRTASEIGNATGAANFNNGATGAQTLRVAANLALSGTDVSSTNPIPVSISVDSVGTEVNDYNTAAAVAAAGTSNHDYTVTALKTLKLTQIEASASGKAKIEVQIETAVGSGTFASKFVQFNSTAETNMSIHLASPISVAAGVRVRVIRTNRDNQSQDLYSTICGQEV